MSELTAYAQMAETIDNLALVVTSVARSRGLSMRQVSEQTGVNQSTLSRMQRDKGLSVDNIVTLLRWLDQSTNLPRDPATVLAAHDEGVSA